MSEFITRFARDTSGAARLQDALIIFLAAIVIIGAHLGNASR